MYGIVTVVVGVRLVFVSLGSVRYVLLLSSSLSSSSLRGRSSFCWFSKSLSSERVHRSVQGGPALRH